MSNYTKATNFAVKDGLVTTDPAKIIKGTDIDNEYNAISNAISSKADVTSPSLLGTPTAPTAGSGTNTTQIASTAFVKAAVDTLSGTLGNMSTQAKSAVDITGGTIVGITDLAVADGGTGRSTLTANAVLVGNGASGINSVSPSTSGNVLTSDGTNWTSAAAPARISGTWQTPTRTAGTSYTNSTGKTIALSIMITVTPSGQFDSSITVGGTVVSVSKINIGAGVNYQTTMTALVPDGATYSLAFNNVAGSSYTWVELY